MCDNDGMTDTSNPYASPDPICAFIAEQLQISTDQICGMQYTLDTNDMMGIVTLDVLPPTIHAGGGRLSMGVHSYRWQPIEAVRSPQVFENDIIEELRVDMSGPLGGLVGNMLRQIFDAIYRRGYTLVKERPIAQPRVKGWINPVTAEYQGDREA